MLQAGSAGPFAWLLALMTVDDGAPAPTLILDAGVGLQRVSSLLGNEPFDGTILTKDVEFRTNEFLQPGAPFAEIAALDNWELQIEVPEKKIGMVEDILRDKGSIEANFILYTQSSQLLHAKLSSRQEISASAYPKEKESVFFITIPNLEIPDYMRKNLRPGLTGRAKLELGKRPLYTSMSLNILRWFRMKLIG